MKVSVKLVTKKKAQKSTGSTIARHGAKSDGRSQSFSRSGSKKREPQRKEWKWQRGVVAHPLSESQWNRVYFSMKKWESEKHKNLGGLAAEGFKGHVATDGSLLGAAGKWGACGWSVVQLDYDEEMRPLHGMYGSMEEEFEVQRTIKRAELTAFYHCPEWHAVRRDIPESFWKW